MRVEVATPTPKVFRVGAHSCIIISDGTRMACRDCKRYVTSNKKGTWKNLGTLKKQACKPDARSKASIGGKAARKLKGGALPPPGTDLRKKDGRAPEQESEAPARPKD
eukprot:3156742-Amphidinium_carterae.1